MLATLGKTLLKSGAKKIAKDKLLNRKKKTNKRRVSVKKIMGMEDKQKGGGKEHTKVVKMVKSPKSGAYSFKEEVVRNEEVSDWFAKN